MGKVCLVFVAVLVAGFASGCAEGSAGAGQVAGAGADGQPGGARGFDVNAGNGGVNEGIDEGTGPGGLVVDRVEDRVDEGEDQDIPPEEDVEEEDEEVVDCFSVVFEAQQATRPVDIVWVVDASPSMGEEITLIEENLNTFASRIGASGLDYHVVLIGSDRDLATPGRDYFGICVPPPLSGAQGCPDADSDRYLHVRRGIHSKDGLDITVETYPQWSSFLRSGEGSNVHFVMVTDDNVGWGLDSEEFDAFIRDAQAPGFPNGMTFHSIVDLVGYDPGCIFDDNCSCGEERGQSYIDLSEDSSGLVLSVCEEDWSPIFEALEEQVVEGSQIECGFELPEVGEGQRIDYDSVNVVFVGDDEAREIIPQVENEAACARTQGWYYDNPEDVHVIHLCADACERIADRVELELGCETVKY